ncbi:flavodoxin [Ligilactobacillus equi]|uniref:flavodoxin n=1 Tax=Ligilactobacillus equi TaxID=137357 RepID=UPI002ED20E69
MKTLVIYFSETGTTKKCAQIITDATNADLYEIKAKIPYTSQDRNWHDNASRCNQEQADDTCRPAFVGDLPDLSKYERILIGHPTWWGIPPRIIQTVLDHLDLTAKNLGSFATSGGSTYQKAQPIFDSYTAKKHITGEVLNSLDAINRWLKKLN